MSDHAAVLEELRDAEVDDYFYPSREQRAALDAAIALMRGQTEPPEGWALVPMEPTINMFAAMAEWSAGKRPPTRWLQANLPHFSESWAAIIAAAPKQERDDA